MKFTIAKSKNTISKKFSINEETDKIQKNDGGNLTLASFDTQEGLNIQSLYDFIIGDKCTDRVILIPGCTDYNSGFIVTKNEIKRRENEDFKKPLVARSKDYFKYRGGEGFLLLDYDPSEDYTQNDGNPLTKDELLSILLKTLPELKDAPMLWKTSSSSCIANDETGEVYRGVTGQHIFVAIKNTSDIERIINIFYKRLWLAGHGYIFIDKTGRMHDRTIIDKVVNSPEREIFLKAECVYPVVQELEIDLFCENNPPLSTERISDLTIDEDERFNRMVSHAKEKRKGLSDKVRESYVNKMHKNLDINPSKLHDCIESHILYSDFPIKLSNGVMVTVHDLFEEKEKYDGEYCYDPFEPDYGGTTGGATKAWIDIGNRRIHGHAHGGIWYDLEFSNRKSPKELALEVCDKKDHNIMFKLAAVESIKMRYIPTELDQLIDFIAKFAKLKKGSCEKAFKSHYNRLTGTNEKKNSVDTELNSPAIDDDGKLINGMEQVNLSLPITLKFPHTNARGEIIYNLDTFENFEFMTKVYNLKFSYDVILKTPEIKFPNGVISSGDNQINASLSRIKSLCVLNGLGKDCVNYTIELINNNQINPVLDWIKRCQWDGKSRLKLVIDSIELSGYGENEDNNINMQFSNEYKAQVLRMWFLQCVAALDGAENSPLSVVNGPAVPKYEHILVFVGGQGVQKTKFIKSLLPNELKHYILTGHELDVKDKDNIKIAISHLITELGELDSTFKKSDISSLKAFMSKEHDQMRMPYAPTESKFQRRTSFCGSVNDSRFLVDKTGNRRYLPIEVTSVKPFYEIKVPWRKVEDGNGGHKEAVLGSDEETQQFWSEIYHYYIEGEQWWPDSSLERKLKYVLGAHNSVDPVLEKLENKFDVEKNDEWRGVHGSKGELGVSEFGEVLRFVHLNYSEIAKEIGCNVDSRTVNLISNFLKMNKISVKTYRVDGKTKKCVRICLKKGERLASDFMISGG